MNSKLFRKKSMDKVSSPEQLNDYIKVASPSVWLILFTVIVMLIGIIVWSIFGSVRTTVNAVVISDNGHNVCYVKQDDSEYIKPNMSIVVQQNEGTVKTVFPELKQLNKSTDSYILYVGDFSENDLCSVCEVAINGLTDGIYPAKITIDNVHPISFILQ